ncbi:MAG: N-acetylmuramoyl-L-alanine amidase [Firmicutes bacterium]|nr:N-acetylmuramoyl-L-alanine amidase [Bacillota bacterium]
MQYKQLTSEEINRRIRLRKKRRIARRKRRRRFFSLLFLLILICSILLIRSCNNKSNSKTESNTSLKPLLSEDRFTVCIDAGHGEYDNGTYNENLNAFEKDIALDISLKIGQILEKEDINVIYTRKDDTTPWKSQSDSLKGRCDISNKNNADIFVSIHCNYYDDSPNIRGSEVWCRFKDTKDEKLAKFINNNLSMINFTENRGLKYESEKKLYVLKNTYATSVLIELGYLSNTKDTKYLKSLEGKNKCARAISEAIIKYKDLINEDEQQL